MSKPIYFTQHARRQMQARRGTPEEVETVIRTSAWKPAEQDRYTASGLFRFAQEHHGRFYASKEVVPIFVEEPERIVVTTVYTFFSQRELEL